MTSYKKKRYLSKKVLRKAGNALVAAIGGGFRVLR